MADLARHVEQLQRSYQHVEEAERRVEAQREIVQRLAASDGDGLKIARRVLESYERTLRVMMQHIEIEETLINIVRGQT